MPANEPTRLLPGRLVGRKRYRIVSLLGEGAMGEVYRADDLEVGFGERVALKFLKEAPERSIRREIQIARKVTHPYVCRVHDLGWHHGLPFLSMECIEGEDLSRLIRRFGRDADGNPTVPLPAHKALALAHQLCAGLAAIHDRDILHRDLKPANVIVDDRGSAKITDFGLADWISHDLSAHLGTVPYMAPEQLEGREVTERSDLYSLGLVLYELFTGKRAFEGRSREGLVPPACINKGLDPAIDRAIMECLKKRPEQRPASARDLAGRLPEPDPDPPSTFPPPEVLLVPDAGDRLRPRTAWTALGVLTAALLLVTHLAGATHLPRFLDRLDSPEVLAAKAREAVSGLGYDASPADDALGFTYERQRFAAFDRLAPKLDRPAELVAGPLSPITFWYRQSPAPLTPYDRTAFASYDDPPASVPGTVGVHLDPRGRLRRLDALPPEPAEEGAANPGPDWTPLLAAAGLSPSALEPVRPALAPAVFADRRVAWAGNDPRVNGAGVVRVEAAAHGEALVSARVLGPERAEAGPRRPRFGRFARRLSQAVLGLWTVLVLVAAVFYARRNLRRRCADTGAALRLAAYLICARMAVWLLSTRHGVGREALETFWVHFAEAAFFGCQAWILYTAIEPLLRRDWPERTASWVCLMHGRLRDPRVARDVLFGATSGVLVVLLAQLGMLIPAWLGGHRPAPDDQTVLVLVRASLLDLQLEALRGLPNALAASICAHTETMLASFFAILGLFLVGLLVRRQWVGALAITLGIWVLMINPDASSVWPSLLTAGLYSALWVAVLLRLGVLPVVLTTTVAAMLGTVPLTLDFTAWYAPSAVAVLLVVLALGLYGFLGSLGGRAVLPERVARGVDTAGTAAST